MVHLRLIAVVLVIASGHIVQAQLLPYIVEDFSPDDTGYYFLTTLHFNGASNALSEALILDGAGDVFFHQRIPNVSNFRVWPDGRMSFAARGKHILLDPTFSLSDSVSCVNGITNDLHELRILDNGHYLLLGSENVIMDLSGYAYFQNGNASGSANASVKSAVIQELDADRNLVWEWHAMDHFDFLDVDTTRLMNPNVVDWTHANALEVDTDGNILLSSRHFNEITKIDRTTGAILWRMGGVRNDFTFVQDPGFFLQHDVRRLPNGHITLFDNSKPNMHAGRGVEYEVDEEALIATPVWSRAYGEGAYSQAMGSMQRLSNGNTLIGWGALTPDNATFTTYDPDGIRVSELYFPDTIVTYRAYYFDELPFVVDRPAITCVEVGDAFELHADPEGPDHIWSTGAVGGSITVGLNDTVHVEVPVGSGGFLRSKPFTPAVDCLSTGLADAQQPPAPLMYPDPAGSELNVRLNGSGGSTHVQLIDAVGKILWSTVTSDPQVRIDLSPWNDGLYFIRMNGASYRFVKSGR